MKRNGTGEREGRGSPPVLEEGGSGRRRRGSSRVTPRGQGGSPENGKTGPGGGGKEGVGGGGAAAAAVAGRAVLTRGDVTYAATTLRLRKARGEAGPMEVGRYR